MAHIDIKHTIWQRFHINDAEQLQKFKNNPDAKGAWSLSDHVDEIEYLYDTLEYLHTSENMGNATVEVVDDSDGFYWDNTNTDIKRQRKLKKLKLDNE